MPNNEGLSPVSSPVTHRIALGIEYDGSLYHGWQKQLSPELPTVQGFVENAISRVADNEVHLTCAGRTDTGVHATAQVVHFDCPIDRGEKAWVRGGNSMLPRGVRVLWAQTMDSTFHARFSALSRRYRYVIFEATVESALMGTQLTHYRGHLKEQLMHQASQSLVGEHDFSAYRAAGCQSKTPYREITDLAVYRRGNLVIIEVQANAFLQHMVRNIAGVLMSIGEGIKPVSWAGEILRGRDRTKGAITASPKGLYFVDVKYPENFALPRLPLGPLFLGQNQPQ